MANVWIEESNLYSIASAIRYWNELSILYRPADMPGAINTLELVGSITVDMIAERIISGSISGNASYIGSYTFYSCDSLTAASFPYCTSIGNYAFQNCYSLSTISFPSCISIGNNAFYNCSKLTTISFPSCTSIGGYAFYNCSKLTTISFPSCTSIGIFAFYSCSALTTISFPVCTNIGSYAFYSCYSLTTISFPVCTNIGGAAFYSCCNLISLYLNNILQVPTLGTSVFYSTPIGGYTTSTGGVYGSVYVPASLYNSFLTAINWSDISSRIVSV